MRFILLLTVFLFSSCTLFPRDQVCFKHVCLIVEVVTGPKEMAAGLQHRKSMEEHEGMLFVFPKPGLYPFWMKDTLIPLDMIWLDAERRIVDIKSDVPPCISDPCPVYKPAVSNASFVLETNAGYCEKHGLKKGDVAEFKLKSE